MQVWYFYSLSPRGGGRKVTDDLRLDLVGAQYIMYSVHIVHKYFPSIFFCVPLFFMKLLEAVTHAGFLYIVLALSYDFTRVHLCLRGWVDFYAFFWEF